MNRLLVKRIVSIGAISVADNEPSKIMLVKSRDVKQTVIRPVPQSTNSQPPDQRRTSMHDPIAKAQKAETAIQTLIANAAERLQQSNPNMTGATARVHIRKTHPEWTELERKIRHSKVRAQRLVQKASEKGQIETLQHRIDKAIERRSEWLSIQPGTHTLKKAQRRTHARQSDDGMTLMKLYRSPLAKQPATTIEKTGEHTEALRILERWESLDV